MAFGWKTRIVGYGTYGRGLDLVGELEFWEASRIELKGLPIWRSRVGR